MISNNAYFHIVACLQLTAIDDRSFDHHGSHKNLYILLVLKMHNYLENMTFSAIKTLTVSNILVNTIHIFNFENLTPPDDRRRTELHASHIDCSKRYNLRQYSWTKVEKLLTLYRIWESGCVCAEAKSVQSFRCVADVREKRVFRHQRKPKA